MGKRAFVFLQFISKDQVRERREKQIKEIMSGYTVAPFINNKPGATRAAREPGKGNPVQRDQEAL